jgi:O-antigen/teichoic acid export membrane protein
MIAIATTKKVAWSTIVQILGKFAQLALSVVTVKLVTGFLGADQYGIYGEIAEYALFFSTAANLGIFGNIVRKMSEDPSDGKLFVNGLFLRVISALIFFIAAYFYAFFFVGGDAFLFGLLFFLASLFLDYITMICDAALQANYLMGRAVSAQIVGRVMNLLTVLFLVNFVGIKASYLFFLAPLSASVITVLLSLLFARMKIKFVWKLDLKLIKFLFLTSLPFGIINIINNLYFRFLPSFFAAKALENAAFASFNISMHIASMSALLSTFLMFSTLPVLKQSIEQGQRKRALEIFRTMRKILFAAAVAVVASGSLLSPFLIKILTGKEFVIPEFFFVLPLLLLLAGISYIYDLVLITLFALEKDIWFLKNELIALALSLIFFGASLLIDDTQTKILLIITAAITGETAMAALGLIKASKLLKD